jgi:hypothetical protein
MTILTSLKKILKKIYSFRVDYISKLWKDRKDIEFVKQFIGHKRIDTTSSYIEKLSDKERQERTLQFKSTANKK